MSSPTMHEYWNAHAGEHWAETYEHFDSVLGAYGIAAIDAVDLKPGDRVLDVGCGSGTMTFQCGQRVATDGSALGIDLSSQQIAVAKRRAEASNVSNVTFTEGDVGIYPFEPGSLDALVSRFGIMFFEDPPAAFANLAAALRPDGRIGFACWQGPGNNEWMGVPVSAIAKHTGMPAAGDPNVPGPFSLADPDKIRAILRQAGLVDVEPLAFETEQRMGATPEDAIDFFMGTSVATSMLESATDETRSAAIASLHETLLAVARDDGVYLKGAAWIVTGRKP